MSRKHLFQVFLGLAVFVCGLFLFTDAFAQSSVATTASAQMAGLGKQSSNLPKLIAILCYVIGVFYTARCLVAMKNYIADSDENPINPVLSYGAIGALLIMLPFSIQLISNSLLLTPVTVSSSQETFENEQAFSQNNDDYIDAQSKTLGGAFANLSLNFLPAAKTMAILAYVMAAAITLVGLLHLKNYGDDPSQTPIRSILMKFVLAAMLISLPFAMQVFVTTVTGVDSIESQTQITNMPCIMTNSGLSTLRGGTNSGC